MSLSQAYGGKPDYTILTLAQFRQDIELMEQNDKVIYENKVKVDDDLLLSELIATVKNLPVYKNDPTHIVPVFEGVQP